MPLPKAVICGSFRRDFAGLEKLFRELETNGCRVLSPLTLDFTNMRSGFATSDNDESFSTREIERFHLRAICDADFVVVHAPEGYIGTSASFEIGYATALGVPVFSKHSPADEMLKTQLQITDSVFEILESISESFVE